MTQAGKPLSSRQPALFSTDADETSVQDAVPPQPDGDTHAVQVNRPSTPGAISGVSRATPQQAHAPVHDGATRPRVEDMPRGVEGHAQSKEPRQSVTLYFFMGSSREFTHENKFDSWTQVECGGILVGQVFDYLLTVKPCPMPEDLVAALVKAATRGAQELVQPVVRLLPQDSSGRLPAALLKGLVAARPDRATAIVAEWETTRNPWPRELDPTAVKAVAGVFARSGRIPLFHLLVGDWWDFSFGGRNWWGSEDTETPGFPGVSFSGQSRD
jgi:hypothetical protein